MNLYFRNTGTSWADPNNWSLTDGGASAGVIPTSADDVFFTANSSNITQDTGINQIVKNFSANLYIGTITLSTVNSLTIRESFTYINSGTTHGKIVSSVPGTKANFAVMGYEEIAYVDFTDINASDGRPIYTWSGIVTNCININSFTDIIEPPNKTVSSSLII